LCGTYFSSPLSSFPSVCAFVESVCLFLPCVKTTHYQTHVVDLETEHVPPKKPHLSQEDIRLNVFFLMNAANFVKTKQVIISLQTSLSHASHLLKQTKFMK
jgi:hypothetical protein